MRVYIENDPLFYSEIKYIFSIFCQNKGIEFVFTNLKTECDLIISDDEFADVRISKNFYNKLNHSKFNHSNHFIDECYIIDPIGFIDYLSTAYYIISSIQELNYPKEDQFNRFRYVDSFQFKFKNIKNNIVQSIFDNLFKSHRKFNGISAKRFQSKIFLSHDVDSINGSIIQDSYFNLKKLRLDLFLKVFLANLVSKPLWLNMDRIMKMESEYDFYSTFYWLVNKGRVSNSLNNSDYNINNKAIRSEINKIAKTKWENGLHKSASKDTFNAELDKLGIDIKGNRYHYLKFKPHNDFHKIEAAGLLLDSSLGFAESYGFRNGYGLPFNPFNVLERRPYKFVEIPLHIMDTTFFNYMKVDASEMVKNVIEFCENNKYNCVISVLFHNNYISDYKYQNYCKAFKQLLGYFYDAGFGCITQTEIINRFNYEH